MNALDLLLIVLVALSGVSGYRRGFTLQAFGFGGLLETSAFDVIEPTMIRTANAAALDVAVFQRRAAVCAVSA